jgi:hypothetical protein
MNILTLRAMGAPAAIITKIEDISKAKINPPSSIASCLFNPKFVIR